MMEQRFVGVWNLKSCDAARRAGDAVPIYGKNPVGRLFYDDAGNMSVHIMKAGRPRFQSETKNRAAPDEMRAAYEGYEAYFATYAVDATRHIVNHRVIGGLFPNWIGTDQARYYAFEGDNRLILSSAPIGATPSDQPIVTLVWERLA